MRKRKKTSMLSVVVPAYNEEKTISKCLRRLSGQGCEIIIVVGGSDSTAKIAKRYGHVIKDTANRGAGAARNLGAKAAKGDVILFTDADTFVPKSWAKQYAEVFKDKRVVAAGGVVRPIGGGLIDKVMFKVNQDWLYWLGSLVGLYQFSGSNCGYRRKEFLKVGGFDEKMSMLEDTELSFRIKGKKVFKRDIAVRTSLRRMKKVGYLRLWLRFVLGYVGWLALGRKPKRPYFASAQHAKS